MRETCLSFCFRKNRELKKQGFKTRFVFTVYPTVHYAIEVQMLDRFYRYEWLRDDKYWRPKSFWLFPLTAFLDLFPCKGVERVIYFECKEVVRYGK